MASLSLTSLKTIFSSILNPNQSPVNANYCISGFLPTHSYHSASLHRKSLISCKCGSPPSFILRTNHKFVLRHRQINRSVANGATATMRDQIPLSGQRRQRNTRGNFSFRLKPRWRLLKIKMKSPSIRSILNVAREFLEANAKLMKFGASFVLSLGLFFVFLRFASPPTPSLAPYSEFVENLQEGRVSKVLIEEGSRRIYYTMRAEESKNSRSPLDNIDGGIPSRFKRFVSDNQAKPEWHFSTRKIDRDEKFLLKIMRETGTSYRSSPQSALMSMRSTLITIVILWIPLAPLMWLLYRQFASSNSPAKKRKPKNLSITFDNVEGVDSAKTELMEVVACLQGASNYKKLGAKMPRGVLLVGPPGTGKTLLARAVAGEAGVPFFSVSASEFVELFVGRGAARIRDLFNVARKSAPSIVFIDELDAVGGKRGRSFNDERDQTLNQLLTEMDGFESEMKVVVIAATNRPEALDPALCRAGRFSRKVLVGEPSEEGRRRILGVHLRGVPLEEDGELICALVAALTAGFVGADLANIVNEASLLAGRREREKVAREDFMEAIERAKYGVVERRISSNSIANDLSRLFPWIPSLTPTNHRKNSSPFGYQTLS